MKRQLLIEVDCEEDRCGDCQLRVLYNCWAYPGLQLRHDDDGVFRCDACKAAEAKAKGD